MYVSVGVEKEVTTNNNNKRKNCAMKIIVYAAIMQWATGHGVIWVLSVYSYCRPRERELPTAIGDIS